MAADDHPRADDRAPHQDDAARLALFRANEARHAAQILTWLAPLLPEGSARTAQDRPVAERLPLLLAEAYHANGLLDADFYRKTAMNGAAGDAMEHYIFHGRQAGADPNPLFSTAGYLARYPDILDAGLDPCLHYIAHGWREGRIPSQAFDPVQYLREYPEVAKADVCPLLHYLKWGRAEGRRAASVQTAAAEAPTATAEASDARPDLPNSVPPEERVLPDHLTVRGALLLVASEPGPMADALRAAGEWLCRATRFELLFAVDGGDEHVATFEAIAPTLPLAGIAPDQRGAALAGFIGDRPLRAVLQAGTDSGLTAGVNAPCVAWTDSAPDPQAVSALTQRGAQIVPTRPGLLPSAAAGLRPVPPFDTATADEPRHGPWLLDHIRQAAGLAPEVTVVVPNYNYQSYLPERLDSIAAQGFQDVEILLLDDCSSDGSVGVMRAWAETRPATRVLVNDTNSGSPFAQWMKGMAEARAELIWMAEADDYCEPDLLASLLPAFDRRNVFLGYVKSVPVDAVGTVLGDYETSYLNRINPGRWSAPYVATDHEEASAGLGVGNCIPNASSVIFRKFRPEDSFAQQVTSMKLCGDWLFYLRAMRGGMVAYCEKPLNYHRRHGATVTAQTEGSHLYFDEFREVREYVNRTYRLTDAARDKIGQFTRDDLDRFGVTDFEARDGILRDFTGTGSAKDRPSILFVTPDLSPGGGQMFIIRLANEWAARGGRAVLLNAAKWPTHDKVVTRIDPRVAAFTVEGADDALLARLAGRFDIDVIHSNIWWADKYVRQHIEDLPDMPWVISMHGCHETILQHPDIDPNFPADYGFMLKRVHEFVHTANKNTAVFDALGAPPRHQRLRNGVSIDLRRPLSRAELGLREDATVLCLATRAIESKGWFHAERMVADLNERGIPTDLMLIGDGPAADEIRARAPAHVHLYGHVDNLHDYVAACDIGILPSFFVGESMPLILLEMMAMGKPVVTTDIGEIPDMLGPEDQRGGILVPLNNGELDAPAFTVAVARLATSEPERQRFGEAARARFEAEYTMDGMLDAYSAVYAGALAGGSVS